MSHPNGSSNGHVAGAEPEAYTRKVLEQQIRRQEELIRRKEAKKRKREEDEQWKKVVKRRIQEEDERVNQEEENSYRLNRELYSVFNDLQGISKEYRVPLLSFLLVIGVD